MPKRSSRPRDINQVAASIVAQATGQPLSALATKDDAMKPDAEHVIAKNPAAVELGRLGGLKGGKARAAALSKRKRSEIAKLAADARWKKS